MLLFFSPGSPYARMIRIAWRDRAIGGIEEREATLRDPGSVLLAHNPSGRVPTLVLDDGTALGETLLILTHLDRLHAAAPLIPQTQAGLAELGRAMGLLDGIAVWNRELRRPEHERSPAVLALEATRANRIADALEHTPRPPIPPPPSPWRAHSATATAATPSGPGAPAAPASPAGTTPMPPPRISWRPNHPPPPVDSAGRPRHRRYHSRRNHRRGAHADGSPA